MIYYDLLTEENKSLCKNIDLEKFNTWCDYKHISNKDNPGAYLNFVFSREYKNFENVINYVPCNPIPLFNAMRKKGYKISQKDTGIINDRLNDMLHRMSADEVADIVEPLVDECKTTKSFIEKLCYNNCNEGDVK